MKRFLSPDVAIEPLFNRWYAWWYLLSPVTAPLFVKRLHTKIMKSFVDAPEMHVSALQTPELAGGPFINEPAERAPEIAKLLARTLDVGAPLFEAVQAIEDLEKLLADHRTGYSLEGLYPEVPACLKGMVELIYDLHHNPSIRFIEPLVYRSSLHRKDLQSIALRQLSGDRRAYAFSTPRLDSPQTLMIDVPFDHEGIDALSKMRWVSADVDAVSASLGLNEVQKAQFMAMTTEQPPPLSPVTVSGETPRVRYFGHACVLFETSEVSILTDPVISYFTSGEIARHSFFDLPVHIDYVVITHGHADHLMLEYLLQLRHRIGTVIVPRSNGTSIADPSLRLLLEANGFTSVREIDELEELLIPGGSITALPFLGEHCDLNIRAKAAHRLDLNGRSFLLAADSNALEPALYDRLADVTGSIDHVFIGMECEGAPMSWMYGPLFTQAPRRKVDQSRRLNGCNAERAIAIVERLKPSRVTVYAMGREPWLSHVMQIDYENDAPQLREARALIAHCESRGIIAEMPFGSAEFS